MKLGIMQPYFLPYIGYFQLIKAVDKYVIYDNVQYTKSSWYNRNRMLENGTDSFFSITLDKAPHTFKINEREISDKFDRELLIKRITYAYTKAPFFNKVQGLVKDILLFEDKNLANFLAHSLQTVCKYLSIATELIRASTINVDHSLRGQDKVIEICKKLEATEYFNAIGGQELYSTEDFGKEEIKLSFLKTGNINYPQLGAEFVPFLSILDVLMFNSPEDINVMLDNYELV